MSRPAGHQTQIRAFYAALFQAWGPQHWWPARTRFEVIVGAYLTQNTSWTNVERALRQLRRAGLLTVAAIRQAPVRDVERAIRSAGYFRQKARRLKIFIEFLDTRYGGSLTRLFSRPTEQLRQELLSLNGVGPETADSILLYAGNHPVFVVDTYTRRILDRHGILPASAAYEEIRELFESAFRVSSFRFQERDDGGSGAVGWGRGPNLPRTGRGPVSTQFTALRAASHPPSAMSSRKRTVLAQTFNEMHGLIVCVGKNHCLKAHPLCAGCPLERFLHPQQPSRSASRES